MITQFPHQTVAATAPGSPGSPGSPGQLDIRPLPRQLDLFGFGMVWWLRPPNMWVTGSGTGKHMPQI